MRFQIDVLDKQTLNRDGIVAGKHVNVNCIRLQIEFAGIEVGAHDNFSVAHEWRKDARRRLFDATNDDVRFTGWRDSDSVVEAIVVWRALCDQDDALRLIVWIL